MTVRSATETPHDAGAAADAVVRAVAAARRRLRLVAALQRSAIAVPAGMAVGAALSLAGWAPLWMAAALALFGAIAAAGWTAAHTPSLHSVARTLDTRLGLRDRVAAALQLQQTGGPIATLVARDAAARLVPVDHTTLFPLALGRAPAIALTVAVAAVAWALSIGTGGSRAPVTTPAANTDAAEAAAAPRAPEGSRASSAGTGRPDSQPRPAETTSPPQSDPRRAGEAASEATRLPGLTPQAAPRTAAESTGRPADATTRNQDTTTTQASASASGRGGQGGGVAARLTPTGPSRTGAGGAAAGNQLARVGDDRAPQTSAAAYRAARASADAALGRDVIPPDYRDHVRAYFNSIGGAR